MCRERSKYYVTTSRFLGQWCISGDPDRQALITGGNFGLTLKVQNGPSSTGVISGPFSHLGQRDGLDALIANARRR